MLSGHTQSVTTQDEFNEWISGINDNSLNLWREAMTQVRQTHDDVWNGVRFFLAVNTVIIAAIITLARSDKRTLEIGVIIATLVIIGFALTAMALRILRGHREYYLSMLVRKTLLEHKLGFYGIKLGDIDMSFPWQVMAEEVPRLLANPTEWQKRQIWRGKITPLLRYAYLIIMLTYLLLLALVLLGIYYGYFI